MSKILVADDSSPMRSLLCKKIREMGHEVFIAKNGTQAWQMLQDSLFDLLVLDQEMPGLKGEEVLRNLRGKHNTSTLPVMFLTAQEDILKKEHIFSLGANDYLVKTAEVDELQMRIKAMLERKNDLRVELDSNMREIFRCSFKVYRTIKEMCDSILPAVSDLMKMKNVIQSKIDENICTIEHCFDREMKIKPGLAIPLEQTYCHKIVETGAPVFIGDVKKSDEWKNKPLNGNENICSYIGIPVFTQGKLYGTLNASSEYPSEFNDFSIELMQLFAQKIGWKIEQNQMQKEIKKTHQDLQVMVEGTSSIIGDDFFQELIHLLADAFKVDFVLISEIIDEKSTKVRTVAFWNDKDWDNNFEYSLGGTPSEKVLGGSIIYYPKNLQKFFPDDPFIKDLKAESYLGIPFFNSSGNVTGLLAVMDRKMMGSKESKISVLKVFAARVGAELERKIAERELIEVRGLSSMSSMTAAIAHEMRTPLSAADMDLTCVAESLADSELKNIVLSSKNRIQDALLIIRSMMMVYRSNKQSKAVWLNLNAMLFDTMFLFGRKSKGVEIVYKFEKKAEILTNGNLSRIFVNIIGNAFDALINKGKLTVSTQLIEDHYVVTIEDNGPGIPEDIIDRIFDSEFTSKKSGEGTGIGLWIARQEVERLHGSIEVESEVGKFTRFKVKIPKLAR